MTTTKPIDVEELKELFFERKEKPYTLDELFEDYNVWYHLPDRDYFDVVLACLLDRRVEEDILIWIYVIATSGNFKSEFCRAINKLDDVFQLDKLTPNTLISGKIEKKKPVIGLLPKIDGKILVIKDFSSILTMYADKRKEIFGQLRNIYDCQVKYGFGQFNKRIEISAKIGALIFTTPIIDRFTSLEAQLGSRFLSIRHYPYNETDSEIRREKIKKNRGKLDDIREQISWLTAFFIDNIDTKSDVEMPEEWENRIYDLVDYVAFMRSQVDMAWKWGHPTDPIGEPRREETTRIYQQMLKLGKLLCYVRGKKEFGIEEWKTLVRMGEDSINPSIRGQILKLYVNDNYKFKEKRYESLKISRKYYDDVLTIMEGCRIIDESYNLTQKAQKLMEKIYGKAKPEPQKVISIEAIMGVKQ